MAKIFYNCPLGCAIHTTQPQIIQANQINYWAINLSRLSEPPINEYKLRIYKINDMTRSKIEAINNNRRNQQQKDYDLETAVAN
jgi:hypothetical protein